jgi:hypothetical protein
MFCKTPLLRKLPYKNVSKKLLLAKTLLVHRRRASIGDILQDGRHTLEASLKAPAARSRVEIGRPLEYASPIG